MGLSRREAEALNLGHLYPRRPRRSSRPEIVRRPYPGWPSGWYIKIEGWIPATDNQLMKSVAARIRLKKRDRRVIGDHVGIYAPPAFTRRRVSFLALKPKGVLPDPQNMQKSLFDALVWHGFLIDDNFRWLEAGIPQVGRGDLATLITIADIPDLKENSDGV